MPCQYREERRHGCFSETTGPLAGRVGWPGTIDGRHDVCVDMDAAARPPGTQL